MDKIQLNSLKLNSLEKLFLDMEQPKFRAKQLFKFIHSEKRYDLDEITVFNVELKNKILEKGYITKPEIVKVFSSKVDTTKKFLIKLEDDNIIETVFMSYDNRNTLCISSQIGCKMGCSFCASTKANFKRNLNASEIVSQIYLVENYMDKVINNIVYMGIGEPLDNYENVLDSIYILNDKLGKNLSQRSITLSTSGLADKIRRLADDDLSINLAISLHYPFDVQREEFMPVNKIFKIKELVDSCEYYFNKTGRRVSYEYVLIQDLNDTDRHIDKLYELFHKKNIHINLIPLNEIKEFKYNSSSEKNSKLFQKKLMKKGINSTIRQKKGEDIDGACGQLRISYESGETV